MKYCCRTFYVSRFSSASVSIQCRIAKLPSIFEPHTTSRWMRILWCMRVNHGSRSGESRWSNSKTPEGGQDFPTSSISGRWSIAISSAIYFTDLRKVYSKTLHTSYRATKCCVYLCSPRMYCFSDLKSHTVYIPYISLVSWNISTTLVYTQKRKTESFATWKFIDIMIPDPFFPAPFIFHPISSPLIWHEGLSLTPNLWLPPSRITHTTREAMLNREDGTIVEVFSPTEDRLKSHRPIRHSLRLRYRSNFWMWHGRVKGKIMWKLISWIHVAYMCRY